MNTTTAARFLALPILSAGILGAALGLAGAANAAPSHTDTTTHASTTAHPANEQAPGWHNHHGPQHVHQLEK
jgi:hypothetical protein